MRPDRVIFDELGSTEPRRELIVERPDGSTYSAEFPESEDLGTVLGPDDEVAIDVQRGGSDR